MRKPEDPADLRESLEKRLASARARYEISKKRTGTVFFLDEKKLTIRQGYLSGRFDPSLCPEIKFTAPCTSTIGLEPGMIWANTREQLVTILEDMGLVVNGESVQIPEEIRKASLAVSRKAELVVTGETNNFQQLLISNDNPLVTAETGGLDLQDPNMPFALLYNIGIMITELNVEKMQAIIDEGLLHPVLYAALKTEFDKLFEEIGTIIAPLKSVNNLPDEVRQAMQHALLQAATSVVEAFIKNNAAGIRIAQVVYMQPERAISIAEVALRIREKTKRETSITKWLNIYNAMTESREP